MAHIEIFPLTYTTDCPVALLRAAGQSLAPGLSGLRGLVSRLIMENIMQTIVVKNGK